jgi:hypothetical protein
MSDDPDPNMKNEKKKMLFTVEYITLKDTRLLGRQMSHSHLSVQTKLETVSSNVQHYVQNKYNR